VQHNEGSYKQGNHQVELSSINCDLETEMTEINTETEEVRKLAHEIVESLLSSPELNFDHDIEEVQECFDENVQMESLMPLSTEQKETSMLSDSMLKNIQDELIYLMSDDENEIDEKQWNKPTIPAAHSYSSPPSIDPEQMVPVCSTSSLNAYECTKSKKSVVVAASIPLSDAEMNTDENDSELGMT
jgi:hypothetical protein